MPTLCLSTPGTCARLESERLRIQTPPEPGQPPPPERDVHLFDIEQVLLHESTHITIPALAELMRRDIPLFLLGSGDRILGLCHPPGASHPARAALYRKADDPAFALSIASQIIRAKILNQRRVLQRLAANRDDLEITRVLIQLNHHVEAARTARSIETLRGYEGAAAGLYFETYATFFPPTCPFERRSRRPPHNAPNAILSFAYTLLAAEAEAAIHTAGLDPAIGFLHEPAVGRSPLALDLIEPFRAPLADAMALDLLSHQTLHPLRDFELRDGGTFLAAEGRPKFFTAYERRMDREFSSEQHDQRTSLRRELARQARTLRDAVLNGGVWEAFLMN
jgi:CRISPR-associated endonuclease Cas1